MSLERGTCSLRMQDASILGPGKPDTHLITMDMHARMKHYVRLLVAGTLSTKHFSDFARCPILLSVGCLKQRDVPSFKAMLAAAAYPFQQE